MYRSAKLPIASAASVAVSNDELNDGREKTSPNGAPGVAARLANVTTNGRSRPCVPATTNVLIVLLKARA